MADGIRWNIAYVDTPEEIMQIVIEDVCQYAWWDVGHAFIVNDEWKLIPSKTEYSHDFDEHMPVLFLQTKKASYNPQYWLPWRVFSEKKVIWINNVLEDDNYSRLYKNFDQKKWEKMGIEARWAVWFPVIVKWKVVAIIEFHSKKIRKRDELEEEMLNRIVQHITIAIEKQETLKELKEQREFIASMSHELRAPMNSVIWLQSVLQTTELTEEQKNFVELSLSNSRDALHTINDILYQYAF